MWFAKHRKLRAKLRSIKVLNASFIDSGRKTLIQFGQILAQDEQASELFEQGQ